MLKQIVLNVLRVSIAPREAVRRETVLIVLQVHGRLLEQQRVRPVLLGGRTRRPVTRPEQPHA